MIALLALLPGCSGESDVALGAHRLRLAHVEYREDSTMATRPPHPPRPQLRKPCDIGIRFRKQQAPAFAGGNRHTPTQVARYR